MLNLFLRNVKKGFATNSSSYHTTLIMTEEQRKKWEAGEIEQIEGYTYDEWFDDDYAEHDTDYFTTPNGEKIVVHCKHGSDY